MKILHINCNYISTELHQTMLNHLSKLSVDSVVFSPISKYTVHRIKPNSNVVAVNCFNKFDRYFFHLKQKKIRNALIKNITLKKIDCIHAYTLFTDGYCAMRLSLKYKIPYIVAIRDTDVNLFFRKLFYLRKTGLKILRNASAVIFLSESYRDQVFLKYIPSKFRDEIYQKTLIIPNGIDDFWIENAYKNKDISKVEAEFQNKIINAVFVGVVNRRKNPATSVKAFEILEKRGWTVHFNVIGNVEDENEYNSIIKYENTIYHSHVPKEKLIQFYRDSAILVMPSRTETFGLTYAEAITQALPVIFTVGQGFDKQFKDGEVGYSVDAESPVDIANKIEMIIKNYRQISTNCLMAFDKYNWDKISVKYRDLYNAILSRND